MTQHSDTMIFVNLPVADFERSAAFYQAIGATRDERFSTPGKAASMRFSDRIVFMLLSHDFFATFCPKPIADAQAGAQALFCLSQPSRAAVDAITEAAAAAGGRADVNEPDEHGFMYGRGFEDPDGHLFGPMWMDMDAALAAMAEQSVSA